MNNQVVDTLRKLMELHALEERLQFFQEHKKDSAELETRIKSVRAPIPAGVLSRHDRLRKRGRRSVAELRHGVCSGCHMQVAIGVAAGFMRQDMMQTCENCGRFLYIAEKKETEALAETTAPQPEPAAKVTPVKPRRPRAKKRELAAA